MSNLANNERNKRLQKFNESYQALTEVNLVQWRGNVFWTGGAQNSKIVSTSGGRTDPPFLERTFLRAGHSADLF